MLAKCMTDAFLIQRTPSQIGKISNMFFAHPTGQLKSTFWINCPKDLQDIRNTIQIGRWFKLSNVVLKIGKWPGEFLASLNGVQIEAVNDVTSEEVRDIVFAPTALIKVVATKIDVKNFCKCHAIVQEENGFIKCKICHLIQKISTHNIFIRLSLISESEEGESIETLINDCVLKELNFINTFNIEHLKENLCSTFFDKQVEISVDSHGNQKITILEDSPVKKQKLEKCHSAMST